MINPLKILHLEDNPADAFLIQSTLEGDGIPCTTTRVQTQDEFVSVLEKGGIDLVLSDFSLPAFDGLSATAIVKARWPGLPFILVSGTLGEELAIDSLKSGATDYVLKERLSRLAPAVRRAMLEVSERKERGRLEAQFIEAQKMEVIGQLAGGVAHDFNNILAVIMGYNEILAAKLGADHPLLKLTEEVQHASERAVGLTRQLLVFSRKQTVQPIVLDLNHTVQDLDEMLKRLIDENIEITMDLGSGLGRVKADPGYIGQIVMNLVVNARDAMPNGGKVQVSTGSRKGDEEFRQKHPGAQAEEYVSLSVRDNGSGMTAEVKARLFEAFFTTKPVGKGTGLGLATCLSIVQQSDGVIEVESEMGRGTTFTIYFPRVSQNLDMPIAPAVEGKMARGTETLLVVEDDPALRHLAKRVLEAQGYVVLTAANGQDALHVVRNHKGSSITLVITDVVMPLMGGKVMAEWLQVTYPDLKILFTSGYTDDVMGEEDIPTTGVGFMPKPYTTAILNARVRRMLDSEVGEKG